MTTTLKKKIELANNNDETKRITISLQIQSNHSIDHQVMDTLLKQLSTSSRVQFYKDYVKPEKDKPKPKSKTNKFGFSTTV